MLTEFPRCRETAMHQANLVGRLLVRIIGRLLVRIIGRLLVRIIGRLLVRIVGHLNRVEATVSSERGHC